MTISVKHNNRRVPIAEYHISQCSSDRWCNKCFLYSKEFNGVVHPHQEYEHYHFLIDQKPLVIQLPRWRLLMQTYKLIFSLKYERRVAE